MRSADQASSRTWAPCPARDGPRTGRSANATGVRSGTGVYDEVRLHPDPGRGKTARHEPVTHERCGCQEQRDAAPRSSAPVVDEGRRRGSRGEHRVVVAAMLDAGPGRPPQAVLTGAAVAEEVAVKARQPVVAHRHDYGHLRPAQLLHDRRRHGVPGVVQVGHVGPKGNDGSAHAWAQVGLCERSSGGRARG